MSDPSLSQFAIGQIPAHLLGGMAPQVARELFDAALGLVVPPMQPGRYYRVPNCAAMSTSNANGIGSLRLAPKLVTAPIAITRMGAEVTVVGDAGSKVRLGIYADNGAARPGALVLDAGTINGDSVGVQEVVLGTPLVLQPGWYWFGSVVQLVTTTQPTLRTATNWTEPVPCDFGPSQPTAGGVSMARIMTGVTGALPAAWVDSSQAGAFASVFVLTAAP